MNNILLALQLITQLGAQITGLSQLIRAAQSQGRDLTPEELAQIQGGYAATHAQLDADIAAAAPKP